MMVLEMTEQKPTKKYNHSEVVQLDVLNYGKYLPKTQRINIRLDKDDERWLTEMANDFGLNVSHLARVIIRNAIEEYHAGHTDVLRGYKTRLD